MAQNNWPDPDKGVYSPPPGDIYSPATPPATGTSPPVTAGGGSFEKQGLLNYDPEKPVSAKGYSSPDIKFENQELQDVGLPTVTPEASFYDQTLSAYQKDSPAVQAARNKALERSAGQGLLFSDIAARGGEGAAFDKSMELVAPDVALRQDFLRNQQQYRQTGGLANQAAGLGLQDRLAAGQISGALGEQQFGQQSELSRQEAEQISDLGQEKFEQQTKLQEQINKYDEKTRDTLHQRQIWLNREQQAYEKEIMQQGFNNDMEAVLLNTVQAMINNGNQALTNLALSGEATSAEVTNIQKSLKNGLQTFTNIWKGSSGSTDLFDFSGIGG